MIHKGRKLEVRMRGQVYHCALDITMDFLGGKWKAVVLWYLLPGPQRFGELAKLIPEITEKMLSLQLKDLEKDGLVARKVFPESPPRVEYSLTPDGKSLSPVLKAMAKWGRSKAQTEGTIIETPLAGPEAGRSKVKAGARKKG